MEPLEVPREDQNLSTVRYHHVYLPVEQRLFDRILERRYRSNRQRMKRNNIIVARQENDFLPIRFHNSRSDFLRF